MHVLPRDTIEPFPRPVAAHRRRRRLALALTSLASMRATEAPPSGAPSGGVLPPPLLLLRGAGLMVGRSALPARLALQQGVGPWHRARLRRDASDVIVRRRARRHRLLKDLDRPRLPTWRVALRRLKVHVRATLATRVSHMRDEAAVAVANERQPRPAALALHDPRVQHRLWRDVAVGRHIAADVGRQPPERRVVRRRAKIGAGGRVGSRALPACQVPRADKARGIRAPRLAATAATTTAAAAATATAAAVATTTTTGTATATATAIATATATDIVTATDTDTDTDTDTGTGSGTTTAAVTFTATATATAAATAAANTTATAPIVLALPAAASPAAHVTASAAGWRL